MTRLEVLRIRDFRLFFLGTATSLLGDELIPLALAYAVITTGTASDLGYVMAARTVPLMVFMLLGGVLADRLPRRSVMLGADVARAASQGVLAVLFLTGRAGIGEIVVLQAVHGSASALSLPAITGLVQETVPDQKLPDANALRSIAQSAARVAGPVVAGILVATVGPGWAVGMDAATFAVSAVCLAMLPRAVTRSRMAVRDLRGDLAVGWREFRSRRWVWSLIVAASLMNMLFAGYTVLGPLVAARHLGGAARWSVVLAGFGVGCVAGGFAALWVRPRRPLRAGVFVVGLFAVPLLGLALALPLVPLAMCACLAGIGLMVFNTLWETTLQREIPADRLARVSAYEWLGSMACQPLGMLILPLLATALSATAVLWAAGLAMLAIVAALLTIPDIHAITADRPIAEAALSAQ